MMRGAFGGISLLALSFFGHPCLAAHAPSSTPDSALGSASSFQNLPDAPGIQDPQRSLRCKEGVEETGEELTANAAEADQGTQPGMESADRQKNKTSAAVSPTALLLPGQQPPCEPDASCAADERMSCNPQSTAYTRFPDFGAPSLQTPKQKFLLAWRDVRDPFNLMTIGGEAAITIGSNSKTQYGPGLAGFGKYAGVSLTQNMTGEFFGTFLIPSLAHQDPRYHRQPNLSVRRRIEHVIEAVAVAQSDDGQPMFNYATVIGTICSSALDNLYVPGRRNSWGASTARISVALATDPIGNVIAEFLPDVARRINIDVVLVQRVINRVEVAEGAAPSP